METKKVFVTLSTLVINYATRIGEGNLSRGLIKIVDDYRSADLDNMTEEDKMADTIASQSRDNHSAPVKTSVLDALSALTIEGETTAVAEGKVMVEEKGKCTLYELSKWNYVLHGDTRTIASWLKAEPLNGRFQARLNKLKGAAGWMLNKQNIENMGGTDALLSALKEKGYDCTIGDSLYTDEERDADNAKELAKKNESKTDKTSEGKTDKKNESKPQPKAKPEPKVISIIKPINARCYDIDAKEEYGYKVNERELMPTESYFVYQGKSSFAIYVKNGNDVEDNTELYACIARGKGNATDATEDMRKVWNIASKNLYLAVKDGHIKANFAIAGTFCDMGDQDKTDKVWEMAS